MVAPKDIVGRFVIRNAQRIVLKCATKEQEAAYWGVWQDTLVSAVRIRVRRVVIHVTNSLGTVL